MQFQRLDQVLKEFLSTSRSAAQKWISQGLVKVNDKTITKAAFLLKSSDQISVKKKKTKKNLSFKQKSPLQVIFEDKNLLVINKPAGLSVHKAPSAPQTETLVDQLHKIGTKLSKGNAPERPGIVHRLDKDTSGVLILAKNEKTHQTLSKLFHDRKVGKTYLALVKGGPKTSKGRIEAPIKRDRRERKRMGISKQGKPAVTTFEVENSLKGVSLLKVKIETGRTHQIRLHLASIGHPIVGDKTYGEANLNEEFEKKYGLKRQFLHAYKLKILGKTFEAPLPSDLQQTLKKLGLRSVNPEIPNSL